VRAAPPCSDITGTRSSRTLSRSERGKQLILRRRAGSTHGKHPGLMPAVLFKSAMGDNAIASWAAISTLSGCHGLGM